VNGILNVLKPPGMTSFDVVAYLRGLLKTKKIGHTGTLDPGAVGVLPVCIGSATKAIEYMTDMDKSYRAELTLGIATDTQDAWGETVEKREVTVSEKQIRDAAKAFTGRYGQIPPMYSAVRLEGRKLYELARSGVTVERKAREVEIYSLDIIRIFENKRVLFDVRCSKGTYIRTLCSDIGEMLGCGGHMSFLVRTGVGTFDISSSLTLEDIIELEKDGRICEKLLEIDWVFRNLKGKVLTETQEKRFLNGAFIEMRNSDCKPGEIIKIYDSAQQFIAIGEIILKDEELYLKSKKRFDR